MVRTFTPRAPPSSCSSAPGPMRRRPGCVAARRQPPSGSRSPRSDTHLHQVAEQLAAPRRPGPSPRTWPPRGRRAPAARARPRRTPRPPPPTKTRSGAGSAVEHLGSVARHHVHAGPDGDGVVADRAAASSGRCSTANTVRAGSQEGALDRDAAAPGPDVPEDAGDGQGELAEDDRAHLGLGDHAGAVGEGVVVDPPRQRRARVALVPRPPRVVPDPSRRAAGPRARPAPRPTAGRTARRRAPPASVSRTSSSGEPSRLHTATRSSATPASVQRLAERLGRGVRRGQHRHLRGGPDGAAGVVEGAPVGGDDHRVVPRERRAGRTRARPTTAPAGPGAGAGRGGASRARTIPKNPGSPEASTQTGSACIRGPTADGPAHRARRCRPLISRCLDVSRGRPAQSRHSAPGAGCPPTTTRARTEGAPRPSGASRSSRSSATPTTVTGARSSSAQPRATTCSPSKSTISTSTVEPVADVGPAVCRGQLGRARSSGATLPAATHDLEEVAGGRRLGRGGRRPPRAAAPICGPPAPAARCRPPSGASGSSSRPPASLVILPTMATTVARSHAARRAAPQRDAGEVARPRRSTPGRGREGRPRPRARSGAPVHSTMWRSPWAAADVDLLDDAGPVGGGGEGPDDARGPEDRDAAHDAEARRCSSWPPSPRRRAPRTPTRHPSRARRRGAPRPHPAPRRARPGSSAGAPG